MSLAATRLFYSDLVNSLNRGDGHRLVENCQGCPDRLGRGLFLVVPSESSEYYFLADLERGLFSGDLFAKFAYSLRHSDWSNRFLDPVRKVVGCLRLDFQ